MSSNVVSFRHSSRHDIFLSTPVWAKKRHADIRHVELRKNVTSRVKNDTLYWILRWFGSNIFARIVTVGVTINHQKPPWSEPLRRIPTLRWVLRNHLCYFSNISAITSSFKDQLPEKMSKVYFPPRSHRFIRCPGGTASERKDIRRSIVERNEKVPSLPTSVVWTPPIVVAVCRKQKRP